MDVTHRYWVHVGDSCNLRCRFCYYIDSFGKRNDKTTSEIKKEIDFLKKKGINRLDFTGGEPTIRKDIFDLIKYAKENGFVEIGIITNGFLLNNMDFCKKLKEAGLNDTLFSIHSVNPETHDYLTQVKGSFDKLIQGIKNIQELGIQVRTNTTVTKKNYTEMPALAEFLKKLKVDRVNLILFNPAEDAASHAKEYTEKYELVSDYLKKAIDILKDNVRKITIRYIPFCFMKSYEEFVCNQYQQIYDNYEADNLFREYERNGFKVVAYHLAHGLPYYFNRLFGQSLKETLRQARVKATEKRAYIKNEECSKCSARNICEGLHKKYVELFGSSSLKAIEGKALKNPLDFRRKK